MPFAIRSKSVFPGPDSIQKKLNDRDRVVVDAPEAAAGVDHHTGFRPHDRARPITGRIMER